MKMSGRRNVVEKRVNALEAESKAVQDAQDQNLETSEESEKRATDCASQQTRKGS